MSHPITVFDLLAPYLGVPPSMALPLSTLFACLTVALLIAFFVNRGLESSDGVIPEGRFTLRNLFELLLEGLASLGRQVIGDDWPRWLPLIGTIGFFILISNLMGLVPGLTNPTSFVETNLAWALIAFCCFHYAGIERHGLVQYLKNFAGPVWWLAPLLFPLELWSTVIRILSLTVRLTANMFADHTLIAVFLSFPVVSLFVPWAMMGLGLFVAFLQAFIFAFLTMIYIGQALEDAH